MPRLDRMGVDRRTLDRLASLRVPITLAESLLSRDADQLALECEVDVRKINELRYLVALRCQAQPPVLDRRLLSQGARAEEGVTVSGHDTEGTGDTAATSACKGGVCVAGGSTDTGDFALSFGSAEALYRQAREVGGFVTTGSDSLDRLLCKGLMLHHVIEVVGRSSSGKTQLCLTAAVAAASHGIGVLYLDTANGCNVRRMQQIARSRYADANGEMTARQMNALLDRLRVIRAFDITTVMSALVSYIDGVTEGGPDSVYSDCRLVILDSVTAVVSPLLGGAKNPDGHGLMATLGHLLNRAASQCSACILVVNTTVASSEEGPRAALGASWEGVPSIRLVLSDGPEDEGAAGTAAGVGIEEGRGAVMARTATVLKHPAQACGKTAKFAIGDGGVVDIHLS